MEQKVKLEKASNKLLKYADDLLAILADEVNVKSIILDAGNGVTMQYAFDTIGQKPEGFVVTDGQDTLLAFLVNFFSGDILKDMATIREFVAQGLKQRNQAGIKVRQPLSSLTIRVYGEETKS